MSLLDIAKNDKRLTNTEQIHIIHLRTRIVFFVRRTRYQETGKR